MDQAAIYLLIVIVVIIVASLVTVKQGTVAVITVFGKFRRILRPGLNFRIPLIEQINRRISIQNRRRSDLNHHFNPQQRFRRRWKRLGD